MNENINDLQCRLYLEAAKFHYKQMGLNIQSKNIFIYHLLAFLPIARSVTLVFQKEFRSNERLMIWYRKKGEEWKSNEILKFFKEMRNICLKERLPIMLAQELYSLDALLPSSVSHNKKRVKVHHDVKLVNYIFEIPEKLDENPEVMNLCLKYLDELEEFVIEAENMLRKGNIT